MAFYPGGSYFDAEHPGYDFWLNFWCDLMRDPALNGEPNRTAPLLAQVAMWALGAGLVGFFSTLAKLSGRSPRTQSAIRWLGIIGVLGMLGVALLPSSRFPVLHGVLVTTAGPAGISAAVFAFIAGWRAGAMTQTAIWLGVATLVLAVLNVGQYAQEFYFDVPSSPLLPAVQKLATLSLLGWMLAVARIGLRGGNHLGAAGAGAAGTLPDGAGAAEGPSS